MAQIILKDVRLSFPDLFVAKQFQGQGPAYYRATFLMDPSNPGKKLIEAEIKRAAEDKWKAKAEAKLAPIRSNPQKFCFLDGNLREYQGYAGNWALSCVRNEEHGKPVVVDRDGRTPLQASDGKLYSGCYVNAKVEIWAQDNNYGAAMRATLIAVQFLKHGESFGGATPASADGFEELPFEEEEGAENYF